uniref:Uncharacterized protein n=1 Tax=Pseudomonas phage HRDY3 TaxID=3236930 RepID=A0AB39CE23_9VIRU
MNTDISYDEAAKQRLQSTERSVGVAQEPANVTRGKANIPQEDNEFFVRIVPKVEIVLGAVLNTVNDVVSEHKTITPVVQGENGVFEAGGEPLSMFRPLSRQKNGCARQPLTDVYEYLQSLQLENYLIVADGPAIEARTQKLINSINKQLQESFGGPDYEQLGLEFSIARSDYFAASVTDFHAMESETVNTIQLVVRVNIHAASLTETATDPAEAITEFDAGYRQVVRNFATASSLKTSLAVAFDVSNFNVRPNLLSLFSALCAESGAEASAVTEADHIHDANVMVRVSLKNPNAKAPVKPAAKPKPKVKK